MPRSVVIYTDAAALSGLKDLARKECAPYLTKPYTFSYGQKTDAGNVRVRVCELRDGILMPAVDGRKERRCGPRCALGQGRAKPDLRGAYGGGGSERKACHPAVRHPRHPRVLGRNRALPRYPGDLPGLRRNMEDLLQRGSSRRRRHSQAHPHYRLQDLLRFDLPWAGRARVGETGDGDGKDRGGDLRSTASSILPSFAAAAFMRMKDWARREESGTGRGRVPSERQTDAREAAHYISMERRRERGR